ncbi:MAG: hypothetical protein OXE78_06080 [Gammaproteobacteria bacterium]|nr:hypothetical protein [Gammaproteobacteria bacterium]MCY4357517.1 hypothetical protein [Gammaproteobacteria bacterium]
MAIKRQQWEEKMENMAGPADLPAELAEETEIAVEPQVQPKAHFTALRRRIEERREKKRIDSEFSWDDVDKLSGF